VRLGNTNICKVNPQGATPIPGTIGATQVCSDGEGVAAAAAIAGAGLEGGVLRGSIETGVAWTGWVSGKENVGCARVEGACACATEYGWGRPANAVGNLLPSGTGYMIIVTELSRPE
jgi:hypothetical protein